MSIAMTPALQVLDWCGSALGLLGAYTLASRLGISRYGWLAFFAANVIYIAMASRLGVPGLLAQQIGFLGSSAFGIYRHFLARKPDALDAMQSEAYRISVQLARLPAGSEAGVPVEVALLIQAARRLHSHVPSSAASAGIVLTSSMASSREDAHV